VEALRVCPAEAQAACDPKTELEYAPRRDVGVLRDVNAHHLDDLGHQLRCDSDHVVENLDFAFVLELAEHLRTCTKLDGSTAAHRVS
jgi:hypothetical protein